MHIIYSTSIYVDQHLSGHEQVDPVVLLEHLVYPCAQNTQEYKKRSFAYMYASTQTHCLLIFSVYQRSQ